MNLFSIYFIPGLQSLECVVLEVLYLVLDFYSFYFCSSLYWVLGFVFAGSQRAATAGPRVVGESRTTRFARKSYANSRREQVGAYTP